MRLGEALLRQQIHLHMTHLFEREPVAVDRGWLPAVLHPPYPAAPYRYLPKHRAPMPLTFLS